MRTLKRLLFPPLSPAALVVVALLALGAGGLLVVLGTRGGNEGTSDPAQIAVLLPVTGAEANDWVTPLNWALEAVNQAGGVNGRPLRVTVVDTGAEPDLVAAATRLARDPNVLAVIGPDSSQAAFTIAPLFIAARKPMITPAATSADLFRAFSQHEYFWRTVGSDIGQVRALLDLAERGGAHRVALVTGSGLYGQTFFDWFGFLATEAGLEATAVTRYDQSAEDCDRPMAEALATKPDAIIAVPESLVAMGGADTVATTRCMAEAWRASGSSARLLFSDTAAASTALIEAMGPAAAGLEGTSPAAEPSFDAAYQQHFGEAAPPYAANVYDAVLLLAYGLERSHGEGGPALAAAMREVVAATAGDAAGWDAAGAARALEAIRAGALINVEGASGGLEFDADSFTDPVDSLYRHWRIEGGEFTTVEVIEEGGPAADAEPGAAAGGDVPSQAILDVPPRTGMWAVLISASVGWENYRHQADVLAFYQALRAQGVPDDHIILVIDRALAGNTRNPEPGVIRNQPGGPNLLEGAEVDYDIAGLTAAQATSILSGKASASTPAVLRASPGDNVFVFIAGHGETDGVYLGAGQPVIGAHDDARMLSPAALQSALAVTPYRRLLVAIEACKSGTFGADFELPRALLLTASSATENSRSGTYDLDKRVWITDQFSEALWSVATSAPATSMSEVYRRVYSSVRGSHVGAFGAAFGDTRTIALGEFFAP